MLAPLIAGQIADRYFATQNFLGVSYILAGVGLWLAAGADSYQSLWWLALASMLFFGPTLGLANSLCFHHLKNPDKEFAWVRLFGTLGWITAGIVVSMWMKITNRPIGDCLYIGAGFAFLNGLYSFTLPHTPPKGDAREKFALGKVLAMLKEPSFLIFSILCFLLLMFATSYYNYVGWFFNTGVQIKPENIPLVMTSGQVLEILTMLLLPFSLKYLGLKRTILIGVAAWGIRFFAFGSGGPTALVVGSQVLHGFCFAFAIAAAMIYVNQISTPDVRGSAQSFLAFITYGLGMAAGSVLFSFVMKSATNVETKAIAWSTIWNTAGFGCLAVMVLLLLFFKPQKPAESPEAQQ
jgi:MFS family permease